MIRTITLAVVFLLASPVAMAQVATQVDVLSYIQQGGLLSVAAILLWSLIREHKRSEKLEARIEKLNDARVEQHDKTLTALHSASSAIIEGGRTTERMAASLSALPEMARAIERMADSFNKLDRLLPLMEQFIQRERAGRTSRRSDE